MGFILGDSIWADTALLLATVIGLLYYWSISTFNYWSNVGVKSVSNVTPFLGNLKNAVTMKTQFGEHFNNMYWELKGEKIGGYYKLRKPALMVRDPNIIKEVMVQNFSSFHDNDFNAADSDPMFAYNLFAMRGAEWKYARSKLSPMFSTGKIRGIFPLMLEVCEELKANITRTIESSNPEFDARALAANFTTDNVATCAFGFKADSLRDENNTFRKMGRQIIDATPARAFMMMALFFFPSLHKIFSFFNLKFIPNNVADFFRKLVSDAFEFREKNNYSRNDMIQILLQLKKSGEVQDDEKNEKKQAANENVEGKIEFKGDVLTAQAVGFFIDGYETSSITLSYMMHELAVNPDIQSKLREELRQIVDTNEGVLKYDEVRDCEYLHKILFETLRKHPVISIMSKVCTQRYQIPGTKVKVEVGTTVTIPVGGIHMDPKYYPNPEVFDPERFSEENIKKREPYTFFGFGEGPRQCVGMRFAQAQVKVALASIILNFELQASENTREPIEIDKNYFLNVALGGLPMKAVALNY